jgi:hypothetical protein
MPAAGVCAAYSMPPQPAATAAVEGRVLIPGGPFIMGSDRTDEEGL